MTFQDVFNLVVEPKMGDEILLRVHSGEVRISQIQSAVPYSS